MRASTCLEALVIFFWWPVFGSFGEHSLTYLVRRTFACKVRRERGTGNAWRPENSPPEYDGPIRLRVALGKSKNVVSVRLVRAVGLEKVRQHLTRFGFDLSEIPNDETVSLGSGSHTPLEVATALSVIANGGFLIEPHFVERIEDDYGKVLWKANPVQACDPCGDAQKQETVEDTTTDTMDIEAMLADQWACSACTFANEDAADSCVICDTALGTVSESMTWGV